VSKIKQLLTHYTSYIEVPWRDDSSAEERVVFCVYNEDDESRLRFSLGEFEIATKDAGHDWSCFDLTDTFAQWLAPQPYAKSYFNKPNLIQTLLPKYLQYLDEQFKHFIERNACNENTVIALKGVGSLFGLLKVKDLVDQLAPKSKGRLLVFFPGSYSSKDNNYRLFDAYDGWNYLAAPITAETTF
jgi:hypothetical protein